MSKAKERTNKKKQDIVEASLKLFQENGFSKTSIQEIASHAGVSQVSIYNYFGNKDSLIKEVVEYLLEGLSSECNSILEEDISFKDKVEKLVELCNSDVYVTMNHHFESASEDEKFFELLVENTIAYLREIMRTIVEHGKSKNAIRSDIQTDTILDFMDAARFLQTRKNEKEYFAYASELLQILLYGIYVTENR